MRLDWHGFVQRRRGLAWVEDMLTQGGPLYSGDQFRIVLTPNVDCYLYIAHIGSDDSTELLYPGSPSNPHRLFKAREDRQLPEGLDWFELDDKPGQETLILLASRNPLESLSRRSPAVDQKSAQAPVSPDPAALDEIVKQLKIRTRNVQVRPDRREAQTTLKDGRLIRRAMESIEGLGGLVEVIRFDHRPAPP